MDNYNMFDSVETAIARLKQGGLIVVADDNGPENEGSLIGVAEYMTAAHVNFMTRAACGLLCVSMPKERAENLNLPLMVTEEAHPDSAAFTVTVDAGAEFGVGSGISASDRATTIQRLAFDNADARDFKRPGHVLPLQAKAGGVLRRVGHTEAAMDFARLADASPVGVLCKILNADGSAARRDDLSAFAKEHDLPFVTIAQLIAHRMQRESYVQRKLVKEIDTKYGTFTAVGYKDTLDGIEHLALVKGSVDALKNGSPLVRVQHENMVADVLGRHEDAQTRHMMAQAMQMINEEGSGVVVYLRHTEDSQQGLINSLKTYSDHAEKKYDQRTGLRDYGVGAQILVDLGVSSMRIICECKRNIVGLQGYGLTVDETIQVTSGQFDFLPDDDMSFVKRSASKDQHDADEVVKPTPSKDGAITPPAVSTSAIAAPPVSDTPVVPFVPRDDATKAKAQANENRPAEQSAAPSDAHVEEKTAKPAMTMRMGGQVMSGQALFEG